MSAGKFICTSCGREYEPDARVWRCQDCNGTLQLAGYRFDFYKALNRRGIWRWLAGLPVINDAIAITMGEGDTPLVHREISGASAWFKLDFVMPTGSYKDRGMSVLVSWLRAVGIEQVIEDSSGNAGSSMAAYCAAGHVKCNVYVPDYTSEGKCVQIQAYGANLVRVVGSREDTTREAIKAAESRAFYASHNWSPFFAQGVKTWLFEVIEQLHGQLLNVELLNLVVPVGQGSIALGAKIAVDDLERAGVLNNLKLRVKIWAVQPENCAPLARAAELGLNMPVKINKLETAAEGIASADPVRGPEVLAAVKFTHAPHATGFVTVTEQEIWSALKKLCHAGFYVEPTSAAAVAGWQKLVQQGDIAVNSRELTVVYLSGSGLKATDKICRAVGSEQWSVSSEQWAVDSGQWSVTNH